MLKLNNMRLHVLMEQTWKADHNRAVVCYIRRHQAWVFDGLLIMSSPETHS